MGSIYDSVEGEYLLKKIEEFDKLLWFAAKRFAISGVLLPEDLYQEGLIALDESLEEDWQHHPDTKEFERSFKSRLFHRMSHCLRWYKQDCRDWRKEVHEVINNFEDEDEGSSLLERVEQNMFPSPDTSCEIRDLYHFLESVRDRLDDISINGSLWNNSADDALEILDLIMDPIIPDNICQMYERVPGHLSNALLAEVTGWDIMKVRRAIKRLREIASDIAPNFDIEVN